MTVKVATLILGSFLLPVAAFAQESRTLSGNAYQSESSLRQGELLDQLMQCAVLQPVGVSVPSSRPAAPAPAGDPAATLAAAKTRAIDAARQMPEYADIKKQVDQLDAAKSAEKDWNKKLAMGTELSGLRQKMARIEQASVAQDPECQAAQRAVDAARMAAVQAKQRDDAKAKAAARFAAQASNTLGPNADVGSVGNLDVPLSVDAIIDAQTMTASGFGGTYWLKGFKTQGMTSGKKVRYPGAVRASATTQPYGGTALLIVEPLAQ